MSTILVDENMAPRIDTYEVRQFHFDGRSMTQGILIAIEILTALFHMIYTITFIRIIRESHESTTLSWVIAQGGLPARWIEYSLTASLMSLFIANNANVYDVYALLSILLGTYATMYFGLLIEKNLASGNTERALQALYIPATALFVGFVIPSLRQLWTDLAILLCQNSDENAFTCNKSCFGENVPIPVFIVVLLLFFAAFPLVTLQKIYYVSGKASQWGDRPQEVLRNLCAVDQCRGFTLPFSGF